MKRWNPLFSDITSSSIWYQPAHIRIAWITIIALKDYKTHIIETNAFLLSKAAQISEAEAAEALKMFCEPDPHSRSREHDGRRLRQLPDGNYLVLNGDKYSAMKRKMNKLEYDKDYSRAKRAAATSARAPAPAPAPASDDPFTLFWKAYPLKKGKEKARRCFELALKKTTVEVILAAVAEQQSWPEWTRDNGKYIPHPATWLNQGRWTDEPEPGPDPRFVPGTDIAYFDNGRKDDVDPFKEVREAVLGSSDPSTDRPEGE